MGIACEIYTISKCTYLYNVRKGLMENSAHCGTAQYCSSVVLSGYDMSYPPFPTVIKEGRFSSLRLRFVCDVI